MPEVKLTEPVVTLLNPCPDMLEAELYRMEDDMPQLVAPPSAEKKPAFQIEFKWSTGSEEEILSLAPGQSWVGSQTIARAAIRSVGEKGLVMIVPPNPGESEEESRTRQIVKGLAAAINFYGQIGTVRLSKIRRHQGWGDQEMAQMKHQHAAYYINQRKFNLLEQLRDTLNSRLAELQASKSDPKKAAARA